MKKTSIMLDSKTRKLLDQYCFDTGMKMSDAFRQFINEGVLRYDQQQALGFSQSVGSDGLMLNEKRALRASIESLYIIRNLVKDAQFLEEVARKTDEVLKQGWHYDNK